MVGSGQPGTALILFWKCCKASHLINELLAPPQARVDVRDKAACIDWGLGNARQP